MVEKITPDQVRIRFVESGCRSQPKEPDCPVLRGEEVIVRRDGEDEHKFFKQSGIEGYPDMYFAACRICDSHRNVEIVENKK